MHTFPRIIIFFGGIPIINYLICSPHLHELRKYDKSFQTTSGENPLKSSGIVMIKIFEEFLLAQANDVVITFPCIKKKKSTNKNSRFERKKIK